MKKLLLGTIALVALGLGGTAIAADMPTYRKAEPLPVWTWAGLYFGSHAGGAWADSHWRHNDNSLRLLEPVDQRPSGWVVGGQGGFRWQWGAWVFGLEATLAASDIRANDPACGAIGLGGQGALTCVPGVIVPPGRTFQRDTRILNLYTATAQVGWAFHRSLWYVKGGWAGGQVRLQNEHAAAFGVVVNASGSVCGTGVQFSCAGLSRESRGWTAGIGFEYLFLQNLSLGIEYDYYRLGIGDTIGTQAVTGFASAFTDFRADVHQIVARANYRLDWNILWGEPPAPAPVRARN